MKVTVGLSSDGNFRLGFNPEFTGDRTVKVTSWKRGEEVITKKQLEDLTPKDYAALVYYGCRETKLRIWDEDRVDFLSKTLSEI